MLMLHELLQFFLVAAICMPNEKMTGRRVIVSQSVTRWMSLSLWLVSLGLLSACDGNTELMKQAMSGDPVAVRLSLEKTATMAVLLDAGADINHQDADGWSALMRAAAKGNIEAVELLLSRNANINHTEKNGWTALLWAVNRRHKRVVSVLIAKGADVNAKANDGRTAMAVARNEDYAEIIKLLQQAGAK
jgi:ankyrin repeat protein